VARRARARGESAHEGACESEKSEFPSERQASCAGLRREFYPAYFGELVDYDYDDDLPEEARQLLAAFTEEHYKGWRLRNETQLHPVEQLREAAAHAKLVREHRDPLALGPSIEGQAAQGDQGADGTGGADRDGRLQLRLLAGSRSQDAHELQGRNVVEDELIAELDERRKRKRT